MMRYCVIQQSTKAANKVLQNYHNVIEFKGKSLSQSPLKSNSPLNSDMDDIPKGLGGWSWKENKLFELALALVDESHPERWEVVAAMVGSCKSLLFVEYNENNYVFC